MSRKSTHPLFEDPAHERHFTADELQDAFANGLSDAGQLRAIVHFGWMRCDVCWRHLKELAPLGTHELCLDRPPPDGAVDPVLAALRRVLTTHRGPATLDQLRPVHRFWLDHAGIKETGFLRLMLEESRQHALEHPRTGLAAARKTLALLERLPLKDLGRRWEDLKALARMYLGDEHRAAGDRDLAAQQLAAAQRGLGTGNPELEATWFEIKAELAQANGQYTLAIGLLDQALRLLHSTEIEGRKAETLVLLGLFRLRRGDDRGAKEAFQQALLEMPLGKNLRLRLRTLQHLAMAELRSRNFDAVGEHLAAARLLEADHTTPLLQAQRLWTEGNLHLEKGRYADAEEPLRSSLERFRMLGRTLEAAQVLVSLGRLYALSGRIKEFSGLEHQFRPLLAAPATRRWVLDLRERVVRWAEEAGVSLRSSSELLDELDDDQTRWVH